jgi:hypothetical protein
MAEAIAALGIVATITQLIDCGIKVANRLNEFRSAVNDVPKTFQDIVSVLPLLISILKQIQEQADQNGVVEETKTLLVPVILGCQTQIDLLNDTLVKALPKKEDASWKRGMKAITSVWKDSEVQKITLKLQYYIQILTLHQTTSSTFPLRPREVSQGLQTDIGRLALLFEACQVELENVRNTENLGIGSQEVLASFMTARILLKRWADATGILKVQSVNNIYSFGDRDTYSAIYLTLNCLRNIFVEKKSNPGSLQPKKVAIAVISDSPITKMSRSRTFDLSQDITQQMNRDKGAFHKPRLAKQVELFAALVEKLYSLAHIAQNFDDMGTDMANQVEIFRNFLSGL